MMGDRWMVAGKYPPSPSVIRTLTEARTKAFASFACDRIKDSNEGPLPMDMIEHFGGLGGKYQVVGGCSDG